MCCLSIIPNASPCYDPHPCNTSLPPKNFKFHSQATVDDLKARFAELKPSLYASRQRWTLLPREGQRSGDALVEGKRLSDYAIVNGTSLIFKDLGPQIGYATVFFWEYFGPLMIYAFIYSFPSLIYPWATTYVIFLNFFLSFSPFFPYFAFLFSSLQCSSKEHHADARPVLLVPPLRKTHSRNVLRSQIQSWHHAVVQSL